MAKKAAPSPAPVPNLFAQAAQAPAAPKKSKGTVIRLPADLGTDGKLTAEAAELNQAVSNVLEADREKKAATNKENLAKGLLNPHVFNRYVAQYATDGLPPPGPISVVNHKGESLTYVVQDKSQQHAVSDEQIMLLTGLYGEQAHRLLEVRDAYGFNMETMAELAAGANAAPGETVQAVIFALVSSAVVGSTKLSEAQKANIISHTRQTHVKAGTLQRLVELCGRNTDKLRQTIEIMGSAVVRYLKT